MYLNRTHQCLDAGGVEHDTDGRTERLRGKGSLELGANFTRRTVGTSNFSPNSASLGTIDGLLGAVDESNTLTQVGTSFSLTGDVFEFEDGSGGGLGVLSATISHVTSLSKESFTRLRWNKRDIQGIGEERERGSLENEQDDTV